MEWSVAKCNVLKLKHLPAASYCIAGQEIRIVRETQYLGVTISERGVEDAATIKRCRAARRKVSELQGMGMGGLRPAQKLQLCKTLVMPIAEYALHLSPQTTRTQTEYDMLHHDVIRAVLGVLPSGAVPRARKLCQLLPHAYRATLLMDRLGKRLDWRLAEEDVGSVEWKMAEENKTALKVHRKVHKLAETFDGKGDTQHWRNLCFTAARKIPMPQRGKHPPIFYITSEKLRQKALGWFLNRFPVQNARTRTAEHQTRRGSKAYRHSMETLRSVMPKPEWSGQQTLDVEMAMQTITKIDEGAREKPAAPSAHEHTT